MRYSIHSFLRSAALLLLVGVIFLGCNEITTAPTPDLSLAEVEGTEASASKQARRKGARMNDRFATETTIPPAIGVVVVVLTQEDGIEIDRVEAENLEPGHDYQLEVTICPTPCDFPAGITDLETSMVTVDEHGRFLIEDFDVGDFGDASYRVDIFVTHGHATTGGFAFLGDRDPLLACQPAFIVKVTS